MPITLPKLSQTGTNEWADVEDNDQAIVDYVNGNLVNADINASAAIADSKLDHTWATWSPTFSTITIGDATVVARYVQLNKLIALRLSVTLGAATVMGSDLTFTLPETAQGTAVVANLGVARLRDASPAQSYRAAARLDSTTTAKIVAIGASGTYATDNDITTTVPFTWTTSDIFECSLAYEVA